METPPESPTPPQTDPNEPPASKSTEKSPPNTEALENLTRQLAEISEYLSLYVNAQVDRAKLSLKSTVLGLSLIPVALILMAGILVIALAFLIYGMAQGLAQLLPGKEWLAFLATGLFWLIAVGSALTYLVVGQERRSFKKRKRQHEKTLRRQREEYGHTVAEQAAAAQE